MTATATPPRRPRLSDEFLQRNTRDRVILGTARAIAEVGYHAATINDIVRQTRTTRSTFYDTFGGKKESALALISEAGIELEEPGVHWSLDVLLIEIAARAHAESTDPTAQEMAIDAERIVRALAESDLTPFPGIDDPRQQSLPPGRHTLPISFKHENQRTRLISGFAAAAAAHGYLSVTIKQVCENAGVSRRTFYERFGSLEDAAKGMISATVDAPPEGLQLDTGIGAVAVDLVAERLTAGASPLAHRAQLALSAIAWARPS